MTEYYLFHGTSTGRNDSTLKSIKDKGLHVPKGWMHENDETIQENGLMFSRDENIAQSYSAISAGHTSHDLTKYKHQKKKGYPLIVTVTDSLESGWQFDYESDTLHTAKLLLQFKEDILNIKTGTFLNEETDRKFTEIKEINNGIQFTISNDKSSDSFFLTEKKEDLKNERFPDPQLLQSLRNYLTNKLGTKFLNNESEEIKRAVESSPTDLAIKYSGSEPLTIKEIKRYDPKTKQWNNVQDDEHHHKNAGKGGRS